MYLFKGVLLVFFLIWILFLWGEKYFNFPLPPPGSLYGDALAVRFLYRRVDRRNVDRAQASKSRHVSTARWGSRTAQSLQPCHPLFVKPNLPSPVRFAGVASSLVAGILSWSPMFCTVFFIYTSEVSLSFGNFILWETCLEFWSDAELILSSMQEIPLEVVNVFLWWFSFLTCLSISSILKIKITPEGFPAPPVL